MKKILLSILLLTAFSAIKVNAQMAAAQKVHYDLSKDAVINMPQDEVWDMLNNAELLQKASNGYVTSIIVTDPNFPVEREITFANGTKRKETIKQLDKQYKFMVIQLGTESLPRGIKEAEVCIFTKNKDTSCDVNWKARIKGNAEDKKALMEQLTAEFDNYVIGFDKLTKKSIPAIRMN